MSSQDIGAQVVEGDIAPEMIERRTGYDVLYADKGGTDPGIDLIAKDGDDYVITEVKFTRQGKTPGKGMLDSYRDGARQMKNNWIDDAFGDEISSSDMDEYTEVRSAIRTEDYRKEIFVVQDGPAGKSITSGLTDFDIDDVNIIRTSGVTQ
ncbi:hypothetical protein HARCEL1_00785 [Halococcoides cellulosivorans]|uniref:Restriction endonuclease type IV Mrr domain-containing protein n=2 Tax=Halococcoides cellulosivorans TaxID=1679096 RepID=A0A2R4WXT8_9EURY|nr:hypothetical protein HARCEL1_00785 [Halococcoides cellulosivorans]